jgi:hypothetical protein
MGLTVRMRFLPLAEALLCALALSACSFPGGGPSTRPVASPTSRSASTLAPTPSGRALAPLPDLTIPGVALEMQGRRGGCVAVYAPYVIRVVVENIGIADALPFSVQLNQDRQQVKDGLRAGQRVELEFTSLSPDGRYTAVVDPSNQAAESDEENNQRSYQAPTPTPPALCTREPNPPLTPTPGG